MWPKQVLPLQVRDLSNDNSYITTFNAPELEPRHLMKFGIIAEISLFFNPRREYQRIQIPTDSDNDIN